jgi:hypothetical protein
MEVSRNFRLASALRSTDYVIHDRANTNLLQNSLCTRCITALSSTGPSPSGISGRQRPGTSIHFLAIG